MTGSRPILEVADLRVRFHAPDRGPVEVLRGVDLCLHPGELVGLVGESGSGKSTLLSTLLHLLPPGAAVSARRLRFGHVSLLGAGRRALRKLRGAGLAMIFQEPRAALHPMLRAGEQVAECVRLHEGLKRRAARQRAVELLSRVGLPAAAAVARAYPHELSGGMGQRVMIAMALGCRPRVLLADEPTTALDVVTQAPILRLLRGLAADLHLGVLLATHDLRVVAELVDRVLVLHGGRIVESGPGGRVLGAPAHPYTRRVVAAVPRVGATRGRLSAGAGGQIR